MYVALLGTVSINKEAISHVSQMQHLDRIIGCQPDADGLLWPVSDGRAVAWHPLVVVAADNPGSGGAVALVVATTPQGKSNPDRQTQSSSPIPQEFIHAFRKLTAEGAEVIIDLFASASLSSIFNQATIATRDFDAAAIHLIDTQQISMGIGWIVVSVAEAIQSGATVE